MIPMIVLQLVLVLGVGALSWAMPALTKPTLPFGVRVPVAHTREPVIAAQGRRYRSLVSVTGAAAAAAALAVGLAGPVWLLPAPLLVLVALTYLYYYRAHRAVRRAKSAGRWYDGERQFAVADTALLTDPPRFPWPWAVPALVVIVATVTSALRMYPGLPDRVPVHYDAAGDADGWADRTPLTVLTPVLVQVALTVLIVGLSRWTFRAPADLDAEQPEVAAERHRRYLVAMARAVLCLAALANLSVGATSVLLWRGEPAPATVLLVGIVPVLAGLVVVTATAVHTGQSGSRLTVTGRRAAPPAGATRDDDAHWRGGVFYVNRDDAALLVPKRFGIGWTLNFGHPLAWAIIGLIVAAAVVPSLYSAFTR